MSKECKHDSGETWEKNNDCGCIVIATKRNYPVCKFCAKDSAVEGLVKAVRDMRRSQSTVNVAFGELSYLVPEPDFAKVKNALDAYEEARR